MSLKQTFITQYAPGVEMITFPEWLATLSDSEQTRYHQARARMDAYRQEAIDAGRMIIDKDGSYVWRDEAAINWKDKNSLGFGKKIDDECLSFYDRFNADTGKTVTSIITEI